MDKRIMVNHGFGPLYNENSKILILGSFPSVKSREDSFYYMHKENRFYKVLGEILGVNLYEMDIENKKKCLLENGIALYDSIESCSIIGSSDSSIKDIKPADINRILDESSIYKIFLNGRKSEEVFKRYFNNLTPMSEYLPSTSPLNASYTLEKLINEWKIIKNPKNKAIIFDLDGTLIDSYKVISNSLYETIKHFNYSDNFNDLCSFIKKNSVKEYIKIMSDETGILDEEIKKYYSIVSNKHIDEITLIDNVDYVLKETIKKGYLNLVYTHRGSECLYILDKFGVRDYFKEILTIESGYKRKPSGETLIHLINKYHLDTSLSFYIGDRKLDIDAGIDASLKTIYVNDEPLGIEDFNVKFLDEILNII